MVSGISPVIWIITLDLNLEILILGYAVTGSIQYVPHFSSNLRRWLSPISDEWKMPLRVMIASPSCRRRSIPGVQVVEPMFAADHEHAVRQLYHKPPYPLAS